MAIVGLTNHKIRLYDLGRVPFRRALVPHDPRADHVPVSQRVAGDQPVGGHTSSADTQRTLGVEQRRRVVAGKNRPSTWRALHFSRFVVNAGNVFWSRRWRLSPFFRAISATFTKPGYGPQAKRWLWKRVALPCPTSTKRNSCKKAVSWNSMTIRTSSSWSVSAFRNNRSW